MNTQEGSFADLYGDHTIADIVNSAEQSSGLSRHSVSLLDINDLDATSEVCILDVKVSKLPEPNKQLLPLVQQYLIIAL